MSGSHAEPPLVIHAESMPWAPSPSPSVWRKRLEHSGPAEAGRVTSIVRYEPQSSFAAHGHPDGEEILVLDGVFEDEHGHYPAGSFLLNPEGFEHAPRSAAGCVLFVKLRHSPGRRKVVRVDTLAARWEPAGAPGQTRLELYAEPGFPERIELLRLAPGAASCQLSFADGGELLVLGGACRAGTEPCGRHSWLRFFPLGNVSISSDIGCLLYVKYGRPLDACHH
jgi:quercetin dioxygenase-like cupin family protein